jgi:hypothetical protein
MSDIFAEQELKKYTVTFLNTFALLSITLITVSVIVFLILLVSDVSIPIFNIDNAWKYAIPAIISGIFVSFALMVPNIPVGRPNDEGSEVIRIFLDRNKIKPEMIKSAITTVSTGRGAISVRTQTQSSSHGSNVLTG